MRQIRQRRRPPQIYEARETQIRVVKDRDEAYVAYAVAGGGQRGVGEASPA